MASLHHPRFEQQRVILLFPEAIGQVVESISGPSAPQHFLNVLKSIIGHEWVSSRPFNSSPSVHHGTGQVRELPCCQLKSYRVS